MAPDEEQLEDLPQSLIEGLKAADRAVPVITARVDRDISQMSLAHFSAGRQPIRMTRSAWTALAATAATVLIAILVTQVPTSRDQHELYTDVDHSGRIDIADVLALARAQEPRKRSKAELDAFAARIVSLAATGDAS